MLIRPTRPVGVKFRLIMSGQQFDAHLAFMRLFVVILRDPLTDFRNRDPNDGIVRGVVVCRPTEDTHSEKTLLQELTPPLQGLLNDESKQGWVASAVLEVRRLQETVHLLPDLILLFLGFRYPECAFGHRETV